MASNDPLHGKTLEMILNELVHHFGLHFLREHSVSKVVNGYAGEQVNFHF